MNDPNGFVIRTARRENAKLVIALIRQIAAYNDQVTATREAPGEYSFKKEAAWASIDKYKGEAINFALSYGNFSAFTGKPGLRLKGIFVKAAPRGKGVGKARFQTAAEAGRRKCPACLDRNQPSVGFCRFASGRPRLLLVLRGAVARAADM